MPTNLNALIRYKTINNCLYGGRRRWSIRELIEACSAALSEYRGRYTTISERTIRDDIRVMRSEILGFNAPIAQKGGLYYYSDPNYTILTIRLTDKELMDKIVDLLYKLRSEIRHPELELILGHLCRVVGREYVSWKPGLTKRKPDLIEQSSELLFCKDSDAFALSSLPELDTEDVKFDHAKIMPSVALAKAKTPTARPGVTWRDVMFVIGGNRGI